jgi:RimJ/RimL family protein N-acetyltransferase
LPSEPWVTAAHPSSRPFTAHAGWLEIGWALRGAFRGRGYASEIGRAGLRYAFDTLGMGAVVSCTVRHNGPSLAVMERIGMRRDPAGDFEHPLIAAGHPLRPHVLYRVRP